MGNDVGFIYMIVNFESVGKGSNPCIRIGKTKKPGYVRPKSQCSYLPFRATYFGFKVIDYNKTETDIHRMLRAFKKNADWYNISPAYVIDLIQKNFSVLEYDFPSFRKMLNLHLNIPNEQ